MKADQYFSVDPAPNPSHEREGGHIVFQGKICKTSTIGPVGKGIAPVHRLRENQSTPAHTEKTYLKRDVAPLPRGAGAGGGVEITLIFAILLTLLACNSKRDIRAYYYPVETFRDGRVYAYASEAGDTSEQRYWYFNTFPTDSGLFMAGTQYDRNFQIVQIMREKIVYNGSLARNSFLYETDTTGKSLTTEAHIESPNLFPFQVTDSLGVFLFGLSYHPGGDTTTTVYIIRNRRFLGDGPEFEWQGRKYPTLRFGLQEAIGNRQEGSSEIEGSGEELYAKDLGLVYYQKSFSEGKVRFAFRLRDTFSMPELERRAGQHLGIR